MNSGTLRMLLGISGGLLLMAIALITEGGHLNSILMMSAFLFTAGGTAGFLLVSYPPKIAQLSFRLAINPSSGTADELDIAQRFFSTMGTGFVLMAILGFVFGTMVVVENFTNPDQIGPGVALAVTCMLYGTMFRAFLAEPLKESVAAAGRSKR